MGTAFETSDFVYKTEFNEQEKWPLVAIRLASHFVHSPVDDDYDLIDHYEELRAAVAAIPEAEPLTKSVVVQ